jgi:hypothetical protein
MDMQMGNRLPSCRSTIDADVVGVRVELGIDRLLGLVQGILKFSKFLAGDLENSAHMSLGDDQGMAGGHGEAVTLG